MRHILSRLSLCMACLLAGCGGFHAEPFALAFSARAIGSEAVPPTVSNADGSGVFTVDLDTGELIATLVTDGIDGSEAHLHAGAPGSAGPVVIALARVGASNVWTASTGLNNAELDALRDGRWYVDAHSAAFPAGEIRGQVFELFPSQEQVTRLEQVAAQSILVQRQLYLLQDIDVWRRHRFGLVGIRFTFGL